MLKAPCGLRGCKNRPAPFCGRMSYKATKPGSLCMIHILLLFIVAPLLYYVLLVFVAMCSVFWLFWLSCQYLPSYWREREHKNNQLVVSAPNLMILGETITSATNRDLLTISVPPFTVIHSHSNQHRSVARLYTRDFLILINDP